MSYRLQETWLKEVCKWHPFVGVSKVTRHIKQNQHDNAPEMCVFCQLLAHINEFEEATREK